jgi:hypothetical protein
MGRSVLVARLSPYCLLAYLEALRWRDGHSAIVASIVSRRPRRICSQLAYGTGAAVTLGRESELNRRFNSQSAGRTGPFIPNMRHAQGVGQWCR